MVPFLDKWRHVEQYFQVLFRLFSSRQSVHYLFSPFCVINKRVIFAHAVLLKQIVWEDVLNEFSFLIHYVDYLGLYLQEE